MVWSILEINKLEWQVNTADKAWIQGIIYSGCPVQKFDRKNPFDCNIIIPIVLFPACKEDKVWQAIAIKDECMLN